MRAPAALVGIPLLLGATGGLHTGPDPFLAICAAGCACLALVAAVGACADRDDAVCATAVAVGASLAGLALGHDAAGRVYAPPLRQSHEARTTSYPVSLEGTLREDASAGAFGVSMLLDVEQIADDQSGLAAARTAGGVRLTVTGRLAVDRSEWRAGRRVRVSALLREPAYYLDPGVADTRPALARRGTILVGSVKSAALVELLARGSMMSESAASVRAWVRGNLQDLVGRWSRRSGAIATAILIGDRTGLPDADERRLQRAGTYHVIAISGGNIAILTVLLMVAAKLLGVPPRSAAAAIALVLLFYARVAAPAPSVSRAVTAAVAYLIGRFFDLKAGMTNVLAVAAALTVAIAPATVLDPGFILSFGATLGILQIAPRLTRSILEKIDPPFAICHFTRAIRPILRAAVALSAATVAAEIALAPVAAVLFSRITIAGLVLNFIAIPLMTCVQIGALVVLALTAVSRSCCATAGYVVHLAANGLIESARLVDLVPWLAPTVQPPSWSVLGVYYSCISVALFVPRRRRVSALVAIAAILAAAFDGSAAGVPPRPRASLRVVFLDVGQGDATLLELPDGRALLVDAGGLPAPPTLDQTEIGNLFDIGERVVVPAARAVGVRRLDTFVLTHPDPDHIGGALAVLRNLRPRAVWEGVPVPPHPARRALLAQAERQGLEWRSVQSGESLHVAGVDIDVLHPPRPAWERQRVRNDDSVVLEVRFGDVSIVLPGDVGQEGERAMRPNRTPAPLVILKAPHHGSATSSGIELLHALRPSLVIFSAGRANHFSHPAPVVVSRYRALGTTMFSTAEDGAVIVDTDGATVHVRGWTGREVTLTAPSHAATPIPSLRARPRARNVPVIRDAPPAPRIAR